MNSVLVFGGRLNGRFFMTFFASDFLTFKALLACFETGFGFRGALFFLADGADFRLFLTEILHQRNTAWTHPCAGAALNAVRQIMRSGLVVLLTFAEPVKLLRQEVCRAGVSAGTTADATFFLFGFAHFRS